jgi:tRNA G26 N,N-dimethylase Trm1
MISMTPQSQAGWINGAMHRGTLGYAHPRQSVCTPLKPKMHTPTSKGVHRYKVSNAGKLHCINDMTATDPAAGSGTLVLALAHEIGEDNCTIYTQDISQKSNEFLRLNLILNNLVHSLGNVVHGDTLLQPEHLNKQKNGLMKFDYIVSNEAVICGLTPEKACNFKEFAA